MTRRRQLNDIVAITKIEISPTNRHLDKTTWDGHDTRTRYEIIFDFRFGFPFENNEYSSIMVRSGSEWVSEMTCVRRDLPGPLWNSPLPSVACGFVIITFIFIHTLSFTNCSGTKLGRFSVAFLYGQQQCRLNRCAFFCSNFICRCSPFDSYSSNFGGHKRQQNTPNSKLKIYMCRRPEVW